MLVKSLAAAILSGLVLATAMPTATLARDGVSWNRDMGPVHVKKAKPAKKQRKPGQPSASARNPETGHVTTSVRNRDGSRTVTVTDDRGRVISREVVDKPNPAPRPRPRSRPWASAYDPETGTRTTAIGNGDGSRTVITISPFGFSIGISR